MDYDQNKNHVFSPAEINQIQQKAFANLRNFHYFISIKINGRQFMVKEVRNFTAVIEQNKVSYAFFIPCAMVITPFEQEVKMSVYDESYYVEVTTKYKDAVHIINPASFVCNYTVTDDEDNAYYYDQVFPQLIDLKFKK